MSKYRILCVSTIMVLVMVLLAQAQSQFGDILKSAQKALGGGGGLAESKIIDGRK